MTTIERLNQIKYVVLNSKHVSINNDKLIEYADSLKEIEDIHWLDKYKDKFTEKQLILFSFIVESMNFCFWKEPFLYKEFDGKTYKRSAALYYSVLDEALNNPNFLDLDYLSSLTIEDLASILNTDVNNPFLDRRHNNFMETVSIIKNNPNFYIELFSIKDTNELLKYIVSNFPNFNDVSIYKGKEITFYKRATLLVNDLYCLSNNVRNNIGNVNDLLACADYGIPRTLRHFGVLKYDTELSNIVDNYKLIEKDSDYEIEIRANMLHALELIKEHLISKEIKINSIELDNFIWLSGKGINEPHHLTKTIYY